MTPRHIPALQGSTLRAHPLGAPLGAVLAAALQSADPAAAVQRAVCRTGDRVTIGTWHGALSAYERVLVIAIGKAAAPMATALVGIFDDVVSDGLVVTKVGHAGEVPVDGRLQLYEAAHPQPDASSIAAAEAVFALLATTTARDLVLVALSGGGSALICAPAPGITLADLQVLTAALLASGAAIDEINTLRRRLDRIKGGGLLRAAAPATVVSIVLSDVLGDPLDVIASGPTVADPTTVADAWRVAERRGLLSQLPDSIVAHLRAGLVAERAERPRPSDPLFAAATAVVIANNQSAALGAWRAAHEHGFHACVVSYATPPGGCAVPAALRAFAAPLTGEARECGRRLGQAVRMLAGDPTVPRPFCAILGGETTVTLRGGGRGGRNQELALAAAAALDGVAGALRITLATECGDGPTDAAGAVVGGATCARAALLGLNADAALANNDSYPFFDALDDLLRPGPTLTNVNDLVVCVVP